MKTQETGYNAVIKELKDIKDKLPKLLPDEIQTQRKLFVESGINQLIGPLEHAATLDTGGTAGQTFGPMTDLAAHGIVPDQELAYNEASNTYAPVQSPEATEIVNDEEEALKATQAKVNEMYPQLESLTPEAVVDYSKTPGGELVVRTMLKRAGVADYETAPMNIKTIEHAQELKKAADAKVAEEAETNRKLEAQKTTKQAKAL